MSVARETSAQSDYANRRRYVSPYRQRQAASTREAIVQAALRFVRNGHFRPGTAEIAAEAGCTASAVSRHFGSLALLCRVIAREYPLTVASAAGVPVAPADRERLAWLLMVGAPRDLS